MVAGKSYYRYLDIFLITEKCVREWDMSSEIVSHVEIKAGGDVAQWLVTCARKLAVTDSRPAASYVQRWALRSNHPANV